MSVRISPRHGVVCRLPGNRYGYFGWPTVARLPNGMLAAVCSGFRMAHLCPFGKTVMFLSPDEGETWSPPVVIGDTPLDDRDAGIVCLGGTKVAVSWFNHPTGEIRRQLIDGRKQNNMIPPGDFEIALAQTDTYDTLPEGLEGSFMRVSPDNGLTWGKAMRAPVTAPHGPAKLSDGSLLYLGKGFYSEETQGVVAAWRSFDECATWRRLGEVPRPEGSSWVNLEEPHAVQLKSGRILGALRYEDWEEKTPYGRFTVMISYSDDMGKTWSMPKGLGVSGSPPHLLLHSSGAVVCSYGRREAPFGERAVVSRDGGETWSDEIVIFDGAPDADLGYPSTVELNDGSLLTVYYQKYAPREKNSILYTRWSL